MNLHCLGKAVFLAVVAVGQHCEGATVGMAEPAEDDWEIDSGFDAAGREEVPEIVMHVLVVPIVRHGRS